MRLAIVEDDEKYARLIKSYIDRYCEDTNNFFDVEIFKNGLDFVSDYNPHFDIIFMDIEMPLMNGLEAAKKIRGIDKTVVIVFITNMAQYAIRGYEVNAIDFIVKPIEYFNFSDKIKKAIDYAAIRKEKEIMIDSDSGLKKILVSNIFYAEKQKNYVIYYTANGIFKKRGLLTEAEKDLSGGGCIFSKCNSGCLVNLRHIIETRQNTVLINGTELPLARRRRQEFISDLMKYLGGKR